MFITLNQRLEAVRNRYREPHRFYHAISHPEAMLGQLTAVRDQLSWWEPIEVAIWWHDAIYDPARTDNEKMSADLMRADLSGIVDPRLIDWAAALIEATAHHAVPTGIDPALARDMAIFLDVDMGILGASAEAFAAYEAGIAAEYEPVYGAERYRVGRAMILTGFLARDRLFLSDHFHALLEQKARANISALVDRLMASFQQD